MVYRVVYDALLAAPAGFGKTSALAQWSVRIGARARVAWVALDGADDGVELRGLCVAVGVVQSEQ